MAPKTINPYIQKGVIMMTKEKWNRMSDEKKIRFVTRHFPDDEKTLDTITEILVSVIEKNTQKEKSRENIILSMSSFYQDGMKIPTWYVFNTREEYWNKLWGWLSAYFHDLFQDYDSLTTTPTLTFDHYGDKKIKLDIPGLFRIA